MFKLWGLDAIRKQLGLPIPDEELLPFQWKRPLHTVRWALVHTRSSLLFAMTALFASVVGAALGRLRKKDWPILQLGHVVESSIVSVALMVVLLNAPRVLYEDITSTATYLKPVLALFVGFFSGFAPREAYQAILDAMRSGAKRTAEPPRAGGGPVGG